MIVDIGCGEARLARELVPIGYKVISFDLSTASEWIVKAQATARLPLPGDMLGKASIADAAVCCLALMGTDWLSMISEAARVLRNE